MLRIRITEKLMLEGTGGVQGWAKEMPRGRASQRREQLPHSGVSREELKASVAAAGHTEDAFTQFSHCQPQQLPGEENIIN